MRAGAVPFVAAAVEEGALATIRSRDGWGESTVRNLMTAAALSALVSLAGCGSGSETDLPPVGGVNDGSQDTITWGPRLAESGLSALAGADDEFGSAIADGLARAARAAPNGASQSSLVDADGRTADEMSVRVVRDADLGGLAHEITDGARIIVQVPFPVPRQGFELAAFTGLIPGIEPDLTSYPHEVLGVWAWEDERVAGAFWSRSPSPPPVDFGPASPTGRAVYEGDAAGVLAEAGTATKFVADVRLEADFDGGTVGGAVGGFRSLAGAALGDLSVTLGETEFAGDGAPFAGDTSAGGAAGSGKWGGRWSDGAGRAMGGTFGFAADDSSLAVLGAFTACACAAEATRK